MYSFYVFEGSFHQGGGGWEDIEVGCDLAAIQRAAVDYVRMGNWASAEGDDLLFRVYQGGRLTVETSLYPLLRVKVAGLEAITFDEHGEPRGGAPEAGGEFADRRDEYTEDPGEWLEDFFAAEFEEIASEQPGDIDVTVDWPKAAIPALTEPLLPSDGHVWVLADEEVWGDVTAHGTGPAPEDEPSDDDGRWLVAGYNSIHA
ncbi:hypothetical protein AB0I28_04145 [Phytomonospora sp. NPDC050363]|uniref:hypothetical protein n=1 Tax=Phytomonospora sp. NPDC050363 TaxID=3155642 RepID=UPI0033EDB02F